MGCSGNDSLTSREIDFIFLAASAKSVRECEECQKFRTKPFKELDGVPPFSELRGEALYTDVIGPIKPGKGGRKYITSLVDSCTRISLTMVSVNVSLEIIKVCELWQLRYGLLKRLVSDGASYDHLML